MIKTHLPKPAMVAYRFFANHDYRQVIDMLYSHELPLSRSTALLSSFYRASLGLECAHTQSEMIEVSRSILRMPESAVGVVVEAGCFKGGSTAKLSWAAAEAKRRLVVFDSFEGIPENSEEHGKSMYGGSVAFAKGSYCGAIDEVTKNVAEFGRPEVCTFVKGWFEDTMPSFRQTVICAYLDVDLVSSTKTCVQYLYPLLVPGGSIYSQDGHLPLIVKVFGDQGFWKDQVQGPAPLIEGLGTSKLVKITKPAR